MKIHRTFAPRRRFLGATLAVLSTLALTGPANAQNWPDRPIKLLVPFAAGGNIDVTGRLMAARLSEALGQQMVVENRVGGGGIIAMEAVQRAAPDGYTLLWASTNVMAIVPATTKVKYDPVKDFAPISELGSSPQVLLVNSKVPAKTVAEFVAYAKAQPAASGLWRRRRPRQRQQPDHGAVPQSRRAQDDQRQLSRHGAGADRRDRRVKSRHLRADLGGGRAGHQSEHPPPRGVERQAFGRACRTCRRSPKLIPATTPYPGPGCWRRRERRSRSSTSLPPRWCAPPRTRSSSSSFTTPASIRPSKGRRNLPRFIAIGNSELGQGGRHCRRQGAAISLASLTAARCWRRG